MLLSVTMIALGDVPVQFVVELVSYVVIVRKAPIKYIVQMHNYIVFKTIIITIVAQLMPQ